MYKYNIIPRYRFVMDIKLRNLIKKQILFTFSLYFIGT